MIFKLIKLSTYLLLFLLLKVFNKSVFLIKLYIFKVSHELNPYCIKLLKYHLIFYLYDISYINYIII